MAAFVPSTTAYTGRLVDIELMQTILKPAALTAVTLSAINSTPKIVAGIQKLAQRYANLFLQVMGSTMFAEDNGSTFFESLLGGNVQDTAKLNEAFAFANEEVIVQIRDEEENVILGAIPDDERLSSATLLDSSVDLTTATVGLRVELISLAGDNLVFVIPAKVPR